MRHTVSIHRRAEKFLRSLNDAKLYRRLREAIDALETDPRGPGCVKLMGAEFLYRVRVGDFRILYEVRDERLTVLVIDFGHRREVYR